MITDDDLDRRLSALAGTTDDDLPELPAAGWTAITRPEPPSVLAARQLAEEACTARTARPIRMRRHPRRLLTAAAVGIAAGAVVVAGLPGGNGPDSAFADWTSTPETVSPAARADAEASCRAILDDLAGAGGVFAPLADPTAVLVDRRGSWTFTVLVSAPSTSEEQRTGSCLSSGDASQLAGASLDGDPVAAAPADGVVVLSGSAVSGASDPGGASTYTGRSAPDVTAVSVLLPDGNSAEALLSNGWWSVWFPGDTASLDPADVVVRSTLADGTQQEAPLSTLWG